MDGFMSAQKPDLVVKSNELMQASYTLGLTEQRLMLLAIVDARETQTGISTDRHLPVTAKRYADAFGVTLDAAYLALKEAAKTLFERQVTFYGVDSDTGKRERVITRWVSRIAYVDEAAKLKITFSPDVVKEIMRLERNFTKYDLENVAGLTSAYAVRLYELLMQWRDAKKTPLFDLELFRRQLGVEDNEHSRMCDLKRRVLDLAITQINAHTDITASYEQHKAGRVITGFTFSFQPKKAKAEAKPAKKPKKELPLDAAAPPKPALPDDTAKIAADFARLDDRTKELILSTINLELSGVRRGHFVCELAAYTDAGSLSVFEQYKAYFVRGLALQGLV